MREIGKALALITQIGVSMVVPIFLCLILGSFLDKIFHTGNILMIVFIILGVCAGFRSVYVKVLIRGTFLEGLTLAIRN